MSDTSTTICSLPNSTDLSGRAAGFVELRPLLRGAREAQITCIASAGIWVALGTASGGVSLYNFHSSLPYATCILSGTIAHLKLKEANSSAVLPTIEVRYKDGGTVVWDPVRMDHAPPLRDRPPLAPPVDGVHAVLEADQAMLCCEERILSLFATGSPHTLLKNNLLFGWGHGSLVRCWRLVAERVEAPPLARPLPRPRVSGKESSRAEALAMAATPKGSLQLVLSSDHVEVWASSRRYAVRNGLVLKEWPRAMVPISESAATFLSWQHGARVVSWGERQPARTIDLETWSSDLVRYGLKVDSIIVKPDLLIAALSGASTLRCWRFDRQGRRESYWERADLKGGSPPVHFAFVQGEGSPPDLIIATRAGRVSHLSATEGLPAKHLTLSGGELTAFYSSSHLLVAGHRSGEVALRRKEEPHFLRAAQLTTSPIVSICAADQWIACAHECGRIAVFGRCGSLLADIDLGKTVPVRSLAPIRYEGEWWLAAGRSTGQLHLFSLDGGRRVDVYLELKGMLRRLIPMGDGSTLAIDATPSCQLVFVSI